MSSPADLTYSTYLRLDDLLSHWHDFALVKIDATAPIDSVSAQAAGALDAAETQRAPSETDGSHWKAPGTEKCIAIVYEGVEAVRKIRDVLGPTDPSKAPPGSIRREFGQTVMVNAAHASDSEENARREIGIVNVAENNFRRVIEEFYGT